MKIKVLLFGIFTDIVGKNEIEFSDIPDTETLLRKIFELYPQIQHRKFQISVNKVIIRKNTFLKNKDEIALLPPFAGG